MKLTARSIKLLGPAHPDLRRVVLRAAEITRQPFQVIEVARTLARQKMLFRTKKSRTLKSRHLVAEDGFAYATDLMAVTNGKPSWRPEDYAVIADAIKAAAKELGVAIEWGGDWKGFFDGPHFQMPWKLYPGTKAAAVPHVEPTPEELGVETLTLGMVSDSVAELQGLLNAAGVSPALTIDRHFGPRTRDALRSITGETVATPKVRAALAKKARARK